MPSTNTAKSDNPTVKIYSYDDLDIPRPLPKFRPTSSRNSRSTSSECLQPTRWLNEVPSPVEPRLPVFPPPVRLPTPPGLPSFGSIEAMSYVSPRRSRKGRTRGDRSRRGDKQRRNNARDGDNENDLFASFFTGLGRILGLIPTAGSRSDRLPPGIVARADDGTYIRARFGHRQSGHGVGAGPASIGLEGHPFHRSSLPTATTSNQASPNGVSRPQPVYRPPPYRSLLDVPPVRPTPRKEPNSTSNSPPEPAPRPNPTFHSADTRHRHFEPHLSNIRENTRSPPRAPPGGYSAPVNMGLSMDGRGDDSTPPNEIDARPSPSSRGEERLVIRGSESDESYCCSCIPRKNISSLFNRATRACRAGCCGLSLEEQHTGNRDLRERVNAPSRSNNPTGEHNAAHVTRRNSVQQPTNTPSTHAAGEHEDEAGTNTESGTVSSSTIRINIPTSNAQSNQGGGPSTEPGRRGSSSRSPPFVPTGWPASVIYRYSMSHD